MENQINLYDYLDSMVEEHHKQQKQQWFKDIKLDFFVSDVMDNLHINDESEIKISISRTFDVCNSLRISLTENFKKIYRFDGSNLHSDWKISPLACYLIIINCNPNNEFVAKAQLHFLLNKF